MADLYLMLIAIHPTLKDDKRLPNWIEEIDKDYMGRYPNMPSVAHVKLDGSWHFGLLFHGTRESVEYLERAIRSKGPKDSIQEILTMPATDLDEYTKGLRG